jgi:hypothetical protein
MATPAGGNGKGDHHRPRGKRDAGALRCLRRDERLPVANDVGGLVRARSLTAYVMPAMAHAR